MLDKDVTTPSSEVGTKQRRIMKHYTPSFKLEAVKQSYALGSGGVMTVSRELDIPSAYLSAWRKMEDQLRYEVGELVTHPSKKPPERRQYLEVQEERDLAAWYAETPGPLTIDDVLAKVREKHSTIFLPMSEEHAYKVRKRANNWLFQFLKRYGLTSKGRKNRGGKGGDCVIINQN